MITLVSAWWSLWPRWCVTTGGAALVLGSLFGRNDLPSTLLCGWGEFRDRNARVAAGALGFHFAAMDAHLNRISGRALGFGDFPIGEQNVVTVEHMKAVFEANNIPVSPNTLKTQVGKLRKENGLTKPRDAK